MSGIVLGIATILVLPFIIKAIKRDGGPIFIKQIRYGKNMVPITMYKFRTMERNEGGVWVGETDNKVTDIGKFMRKSHIDELPQAFNLLRGNLSLVGVRPDIIGLGDRLLKEIPNYRARYVLKPGITGWAQVHGRNAISWEKKFKLDVWYIDNWSIWLDMRIILMTIKKVIKREGIYKKGNITVEEFKGHK